MIPANFITFLLGVKWKWRKERNQNKGGKGGVDNLGVYVISIPQSKLKEEILIGRDGKNHAQCDKIS